MNTSAESGTPDLELHGAKRGNCLRAAIGLSEAGLLYKIRQVGLGRGSNKMSRIYRSIPREKFRSLPLGVR